MPKFTYKSVKTSVYLGVVVAVTAGVGLAGSPGAAAGERLAAKAFAEARLTAKPFAGARLALNSLAGAQPAAKPLAGAQLAPKPLKTALIGVSDLPAGYKSMAPPTDDWVDMPETETDACGNQPAPAPTDPPAAPHLVHYASTSFSKAGTDIVSEFLAANGDRAARADVAFIANMPRLCPVITDGEAGSRTTLSVFAVKIPRLGDVSAALRYVIKMDGATMVMRGEVIAFALHGVSASITYDGPKGANQGQLANVAKKALAKLTKYKP